MDFKALLLLVLVQLVFVTCESGELYDEDVQSRFDGLVLSKRDLPDLDPGFVHAIMKRQSIGYTDYSREEADAIVERHNFHRANTKPTASNMRYMRWDDELATMSQRWADKCVYEHGGTDNSQQFSAVGQNLAIGTSPMSADGAYATDLWHSEDEFYTLDSNYCIPGEVCGHYTQVVWADTYAVGCGRKFCPSVLVNGNIWKNAYYVVCDYGPPGNYRGVKPFQTGDRCSECPNDAGFCTDNSLCRDCTSASNTATCGECTRICENCGTLDSDTCTCQCAPGWDGPTCSDVCANHHDWCGANPGWYGPELCNNYQYEESVRKYCKKMCGICQPEDSSFVCGGGVGGDGGGGKVPIGGDSGGGGGSGCTDQHPSCGEWADANECELNPNWMQTNCERSCGVCEPTMKNTKYCKTSFTATSVIDGNLFTFKKDKYWRFNDIKNGELQTSASGDLVRDVFPKVNPDVRAVYQRPDDKVVIFRGAKYWLYTNTGSGWTRDSGFPRSSSSTFPGLPSPTAAVYDSIEDKTYFFSGANYWRYDEYRKQFDVEKRPVSSRFDGIPSKISGAFIDDNSDFILIKGKDFWRVRRGENRVSSVEPKNLALEFLDCYE